MAELTGLEAIQADEKLTTEAKALAVDAAALEASVAELKDVDGVVTFQSLVDRMKADSPDAKASDVEAAVIAVWIF
jgi:mannitol-specific phosphotransferase system IIBC component